MLRPSQIVAIFGVFLSMFYIFKYAGTNPEYANTLCQELIDLQMDVVAEVSPVIRMDTSDRSFDEKLREVIMSFEANPVFSERQDRIRKIQRQLDGRACPAPNLVQMTRLVVSSI